MHDALAIPFARVPVVKFTHPELGVKCDVTIFDGFAC
jgi:hypothetical protein